MTLGFGAMFLCTGMVHAAGPAEGQLYVSPMISASIADDSRITSDSAGRGGQLGLGYAVSSAWLVEGNVQYYDHEGPGASEDWGGNVDLLRRWQAGESLSPYLLAGLGWMRSRPDDPRFERRNDHTLSFGAGAMWSLTDTVAVRGDYRLRLDTDNPILKDQLFSLGLVFSFSR